MNQHTLDARRLLCPMPVIRTQNKIKMLSSGDILRVTCTDPGVIQDIPAWCKINGHKFIGYETQGDELVLTIEVGED